MYRNHDTPKIDFLMVLAVATVMFFLTLFALASVGFVPSYIDGVYPENEAGTHTEAFAIEAPSYTASNVALTNVPQLGETSSAASQLSRSEPASNAIEPSRIVIHAIGVDVPVLNPAETSVSVLDEALLKGAVRYPLSVKLNEDGNMFIFGHSTTHSIVQNQMYKAFNRLGELREGDTVKIVGGGEAHIYRVKNVRRADADESVVNLSTTNGVRKLTLATCDFSFSDKTSRFIVEADFIGSYKDQ